ALRKDLLHQTGAARASGTKTVSTVSTVILRGEFAPNQLRDDRSSNVLYGTEVLHYMESKTRALDRRTARPSGAGDEDYFAMVLLNYEAEHEISFTLHHYWEVSSFNTESGNASINLNVDVGDDEEDKSWNEVVTPYVTSIFKLANKHKFRRMSRAFLDIWLSSLTCGLSKADTSRYANEALRYSTTLSHISSFARFPMLPTTVLLDVDIGRISILHCEILKSITLNVLARSDDNA
ncbi:hypothetical protein Tco_0942378, partial [Tanacetum coccineum]